MGEINKIKFPPKLLRAVDKASDSDRLFFERRPRRNFRVRRSHRAEVVQNAIIDDLPPLELPGMAWFAAVLNVCPGYRMRLFMMVDADFDTDIGEREARETFESLATPMTWQIAEKIAATVCGEGAR